MQEPIEEPKEEIITEKLPWYKRLKNWLIGGGTALALTVGGVAVGVNIDGHADKPFYAVNPITKDSLWYADTTKEYLALVDSFSRIITYPERVIPEHLALSEDLLDTTVIPASVDRPISKFAVAQTDTLKVGDVITADLFINGKWVSKLYTKVDNPASCEGCVLRPDGKIRIIEDRISVGE